MKTLIIHLISFYQKFLSYILKNIFGVSYFCKFRPTCSEYARIVIEKEGVLKGGALAIVRILKCQPLYKGNLNI